MSPVPAEAGAAQGLTTPAGGRVGRDALRGTEIGLMFLNSMPRLDVLSDDDLATLDAGWERLAAEVGVRFDHPRALELFRDAGQTVDGEVVHFDPGFLRAQVALVPASFHLHARNRARNLEVGGDQMIFAATNGPPFVRAGGERRDGSMADLERFLMMT